MTGAAFMLAHQVAGKAARDALFLAEYTPKDLPGMVIAAAGAAIVLSFFFSRLLANSGPRLAVPVTFLVSAALHLAEWIMLPVAPRIAVIGIYLHIVGLGAILLSGFWALASELFDPREAKVRFGRIAGMGTAGGIAGGLLAERTAAWFAPSAVLLLLAACHLAVGVALSLLRGEAEGSHKPAEALPSPRDVFGRAPFLWSLAVLVLVGTTSAAMLDYLFKSGAVQQFGGRSPALLRYFALFYTAAQVLTFLVQVGLSRLSLEKLGLARTVGSLPFAVGAGSVLALFLPVFSAIASVRALELILRGSLFRAGYEIFYTPIAARDKRSVKVLIDVGCDRLGDAVGAGIVQFAIWMGPALARTELLAATILLAVLAGTIASWLDKAYRVILERGLIDRAVDLDLVDVHDSTTMSIIMRSAVPVSAAPAKPEITAPRLVSLDPLADTLGSLRSGDAAQVKAALDGSQWKDPLVVPQLIRLLAWDEVRPRVEKCLAASMPAITGQLSDALLDEQEDFAIRRRIPRLLARAHHSPRAAAALVEALDASRFEVRFQCGRALDAMRQHHPGLALPEPAIWAVIERELNTNLPIWQGYRLLEKRESTGDEAEDRFNFLDDLLRERSNLSLEHVFSLLALVLPREPLKIAFRALHTEDRQLRGLALEYLESVLPTSVRTRLWDVLEGSPKPESTEPPTEALERLMQSQAMVQLKFPDGRSGRP
ncbi:MAG: hypothetical protein K2X03_16745 [Bryobacteraceae bacterium]|nr:hypothetical protein [Bryobacteraceae bacterium]